MWPKINMIKKKMTNPIREYYCKLYSIIITITIMITDTMGKIRNKIETTIKILRWNTNVTFIPFLEKQQINQPSNYVYDAKSLISAFRERLEPPQELVTLI